MATRRVEISIDKAFRRQLCRSWIRKTALAALDVALPQQSCQLSLAICDDETILRLNREYRGVDEVTDVLAFSSQHPGSWQGKGGPSAKCPTDDGPFVLPPEEPPYVGEVLISYPQVCRQAAEAGNTPERETALLVNHGILHLLGYDHQEPQQEATMEEKQKEALALLFP